MSEQNCLTARQIGTPHTLLSVAAYMLTVGIKVKHKDAPFRLNLVLHIAVSTRREGECIPSHINGNRIGPEDHPLCRDLARVETLLP